MANNDFDRWLPLLLAIVLARSYDDDDYPLQEDLYFDLMRLIDRSGPDSRASPDVRHFLERLLMHPRRRGSRRERTRSMVQEEVERLLSQESPVSQSVSRFLLSGLQSTLGQETSRIQTIERQLSQRIGGLEQRVSGVHEQVRTTADNLATVATDHLYTTEALYDLIWLLSVGANLPAAKFKRHVPVRIYLAEPPIAPQQRQALVDAIDQLAQSLGFETAFDLPDETGSWWKRFMLRTKEALNCDEVQSRLGKAGRAFEARHINRPEAEANRHQAEAAAALIKSLETTKSACIQVGSLLLVKLTNSSGDSAVVSRTLTPEELARLEENQSILREPGKILDWLQHAHMRTAIAAPRQD